MYHLHKQLEAHTAIRAMVNLILVNQLMIKL